MYSLFLKRVMAIIIVKVIIKIIIIMIFISHKPVVNTVIHNKINKLIIES